MEATENPVCPRHAPVQSIRAIATRMSQIYSWLMDAQDFRRLALSLPGAEESSHMGSPDFRVGGRIFATLAMKSKGYGNLMLTPDQQAGFVEEAPDVFIAIPGGWGRMGATHVVLALVAEDILAG